MTTVHARAWCRADLAGGTLDIWPLGLLHDGAATVNVALDVPVTVSLSLRGRGYVVAQGEDRVEAADLVALAGYPQTALVAVVAAALALPPAEVVLESGSPRGGGLGASSALTVALLAAAERLLERPASSPAASAVMARDLEARLMGLPTGTQDHFPALLGGVLAIEHRPGGARPRRLAVDLEALAGSLVIAFSGTSHFSAGSNWQVVRRRLEGDAAASEHLSGVAAVAAALPPLLEAGDLAAAGRLLTREHGHRRQLAEGVSPPAIERLLAAAISAGAWGGKVCGAGGGGSVAILCPPARRAAVAAALRSAGGQPLDARPVDSALAVETRP